MQFVRCILLLVLLSAGATAQDGASSFDWPCWRGAAYDGISRETHWDSEGRGTLWRQSVGRGYSSPSVVSGRLLITGFHEGEGAARGEDEKRILGVDRVLCLDAVTGETIWAMEYPSELMNNMHEGGTLTTPTIVDDRVYLLSRMGALRCLDLASGEERWMRPIAEEFNLNIKPFGFNTSPVVLEDQVIVNANATLSLSCDSGDVEWSTEDYGYSYGTPMPFERDGELMLAVFNGAGLTVLDAVLGEEVMLFEWTSGFNVNCATPIVQDGRVFISTGYDNKGCALLDVRGDEVAVEWEGKQMRNKMSGCVLLDDHLYGFDDKTLACVNWDGSKVWNERGVGSGALQLAGDRLMALTEDGEFRVVRATPDGYEELARDRVFEEGVCWTPPVLCNGLIYLRNNKGDLVCRDHRAKAKGVSDGSR